MYRISEFEKVSKERFCSDFLKLFPEYKDKIGYIYDNIKLPVRATSGSAGYDFSTPVGFTLKSGETINIPTGIRVRMDEGWVLAVFPRSGLGFKFRLQLNNTVGIIDSDYYGSENEGHIFIKMTNCSNEDKAVELSSGDKFAQGIFLPFGITVNDTCTEIRDGGFGSTDR